jgi:hypothetical protein
MGNCCTNSSKKNPSPAKTHSRSEQRQETSPPRFLKLKSREFNFSYKLEYHSTKPLSTYLNHVFMNNPELVTEELQVLKRNQEIENFNLKLKDLEIFPSDVLYVESKPVVPKEEPLSPSMSNEGIAEEESTTKLQVAGIKAKLNMGSQAKTESTGDAASLWRSAMPSPKHMKQSSKDPDASSLINPMDLTIENKLPLQFMPYDVKNGQSVLLDSDDSYMKNDVKGRDSLCRHPYDFFKDLQGPFSVLKQL